MWLENFQEYFLQIHRLNPCISANVSLVAWLVNGCRTPVTGFLSYGLRWCSPVAVLHVIGTKLGPDLSPFLLSNWLFVCGWLEIFFVSLGLGNSSTHHLGECMLVPLQSPGSNLPSGQRSCFLFRFFIIISLPSFFSSGTPIIWASASMTMSFSRIFALYFEIFLPWAVRPPTLFSMGLSSLLVHLFNFKS